MNTVTQPFQGHGGVRSGGRVTPVRSMRGLLLFFILGMAIFMIADVFLNVQRVRFGSEIQTLRRQIVLLGGDVRDLEGVRAGLTSLASIEQQARNMGMVYPKRVPRLLVVEVPSGELPPAWALPSPRANHDAVRGPSGGHFAHSASDKGWGQ